MEPSDEALAEAARAGDRTAFEQLYLRHRDWAASVAFRFCQDREDALDVLQETFAYFFRKLPDFELRSAFRTFLYPVVKHLALNRRRDRRAPLPRAAPRKDDGGEVDDLLVSLPDAQREVVWMRFVDGLSLREIAEALEVPLGTVKSRLHNAIEALRSRPPADP